MTSMKSSWFSFSRFQGKSGGTIFMFQLILIDIRANTFISKNSYGDKIFNQSKGETKARQRWRRENEFWWAGQMEKATSLLWKVLAHLLVAEEEHVELNEASPLEETWNKWMFKHQSSSSIQIYTGWSKKTPCFVFSLKLVVF